VQFLIDTEAGTHSYHRAL